MAARKQARKRKKPARPRFTKAKQAECADLVRKGMRPGAAAEALGFTRDECFTLLEENEDFAELITLATKEATEHVEEALFQAAVSGNVTAARIWLDRSQPKSTALVAVGSGDELDREIAEMNAIARERGT